jgi:hypothetical protein
VRPHPRHDALIADELAECEQSSHRLQPDGVCGLIPGCPRQNWEARPPPLGR